MLTKMTNDKSKVIAYIVFGFALGIVILNIISLIFPSLLVTLFVGTDSKPNSFELGIWAIPFFLINLLILIFGVLYYKKKIPKKIIYYLEFILKFEVSRKATIIVFSIFLVIYFIFTVGELSKQEIDVWKDWEILGPIIEEFPSIVKQHPALSIQYVKNFLLFSSDELFQNVKILPFIGSISLIFLVYFFTVQISQKRFAGLIAVIILLQSHTFLRYDTTATFSNFWISFYLVSLYLIIKKWPLSPLAYIGSIFSKAITAVFLPLTLFFIYRTHTTKKTKIVLTISYLIIFIFILAIVIISENLGYGKSLTSFQYADFISGFTVLTFQLRIDGLVLMFLLPLTIGLFIKSRKGFKVADSILVLIAGILLSAPLLVGFSEFNIQPYRWIPLIVFFAIGVGVLLKTSTNRSVN